MIKKMKKITVVLSLFLFVFDSFGKKNKDEDYVAEVEKYLNGITTFESDFVQSDRRGRRSSGHIYIKRPFSLKMDYKQPSSFVIIAGKNKIIRYDRELKEKTETSTHSSPLSFFLERKIDLHNNPKIMSIQNEEDMLAIKFCKKNDSENGAVVLFFSKNPLTLRKWIILPNKDDESYYEGTEISLFNWKIGGPIPDEEFEKYSR
jgi:outer membrane lipoprotein-sorting protein